MKSDIDEVSLQGIEFWSTVCDEEVDLGIELQEVKIFMSLFWMFELGDYDHEIRYTTNIM